MYIIARDDKKVLITLETTGITYNDTDKIILLNENIKVYLPTNRPIFVNENITDLQTEIDNLKLQGIDTVVAEEYLSNN